MSCCHRSSRDYSGTEKSTVRKARYPSFRGTLPSIRSHLFFGEFRLGWQQCPDSLRKNPLNDSVRRLPDLSWRSGYYLISNTTKSTFWAFSSALNTAGRNEMKVSIRRTGHFRITFGLFLKASPGAHPFIWKLVFICMWMKTNFHMKGWAPGLALKKRPKVIRKWPISCCDRVFFQTY